MPPQSPRGGAGVTLRRRGAPDLAVGPGDRRIVGATALQIVPAVAAYVEARDAAGRRLTITQPTNPAFLSPVLFFPERVTISNTLLPADSFATPALHRQIKAFYFAKDAAGVARAHGVGARTAVLFAVDDDGGRLVPGGIGFAESGRETTLAGVRLLADARDLSDAADFIGALSAGAVARLRAVARGRRRRLRGTARRRSAPARPRAEDRGNAPSPVP